MIILHLNLRKKWFDLIHSGQKKEEYREIKPSWNRIFNGDTIKIKGKRYHYSDVTICFSNGMAKDRPQFFIECKGLTIGSGRKEWGAVPGEEYYVLKLGKKILSLGSLFTGIGGFEEGALRAGGIKTVFQVEQIKFRQETTKKYGGAQYQDIKEFDATKYNIDILCGGFPCQNISVAGNGKGIYGSKSSLWWEFYRIIKETNPRYIIIENGPNLKSKGLGSILHALASIGYDAEWKTISNSAFGMPHQRNRMYIIAYSTKKRWSKNLYSDEISIYKSIEKTKCQILGPGVNPTLEFGKRMGQSAICAMDDGFPGRPFLIERLEAVGDTMSPIVAEYLFHCIKIHYATYA